MSHAVSVPKVVTIGGGTGHFTLLRGLQKYPVQITAVVSMADDGGSTGILRDEMGVLPPGDVRQCLVALSEESDVLRSLFSYRFEQGGLAGHSFGNLFLSALEKVTGSFSGAVAEASRILRVRGEVLPVTEDNMRLRITLEDGSTIEGQYALDAERASHAVSEVQLVLPVQAYPKVLDALQQADVVVIGPGDLYGSIIPPLLVDGVVKALAQTQALVVYVANLTNKRMQTDGFTVERYADSIEHYLGPRLDVVVCNSQEPPKDLVRRYEEKEGAGMMVLGKSGKNKHYDIVARNLVAHTASAVSPADALSGSRSFIRHDSARLAETVMELVRTKRDSTER